MADQTTHEDASNDDANGQQRSATDNLRELTEASKQLLEAGKQMTENLTELSGRVEHAKNVGSQVLKSPWLVAGGAVAAGLVVLLISRHQ